MTPFEELAHLFTCGTANRGLLRMDFDEAAALYKAARGSRSSVEIGRKHGGSAILIAAAMSCGWLVSIDRVAPPAELAGQLSGFAPIVTLVTGLSGEVRQDEAPWPLDLLLIDGDHSYEGAKADWQRWSPLVARDGVVAFHDMAAARSGATQWPELARLRDEIVADGNFAITHEVGSLSFFRRLNSPLVRQA